MFSDWLLILISAIMIMRVTVTSTIIFPGMLIIMKIIIVTFTTRLEMSVALSLTFGNYNDAWCDPFMVATLTVMTMTNQT